MTTHTNRPGSNTVITTLSKKPLYTQGECHDLNRPGETVYVGGDEIHARNLCFDYIINVDLRNADLRGVYLFNTTFAYVDFEGADLTGAQLGDTVFLACRNLDKAKGLDAVDHDRPSVIDTRTLALSGYNLPNAFLEGCGFSAEVVSTFLEALDAIDVDHGEVDDTAVREEVVAAIEGGYMDQREGFFVDGSFGMFSAQGARLVRSTVRRFVRDANRLAKLKAWNTPRMRVEALVAAASIRRNAEGRFPLDIAGEYYAAYIAELE